MINDEQMFKQITVNPEVKVVRPIIMGKWLIHIDRIYIPETQGKITSEKVELTFEDGRKFMLMEKKAYTIFQ